MKLCWMSLSALLLQVLLWTPYNQAFWMPAQFHRLQRHQSLASKRKATSAFNKGFRQLNEEDGLFMSSFASSPLFAQASRTPPLFRASARRTTRLLQTTNENEHANGDVTRNGKASSTTIAVANRTDVVSLNGNKDNSQQQRYKPQSKSKSSIKANSNAEQLEDLYSDFPRTWVPLGSTLELDPDRPNRLEFLEQSYVAYAADTAASTNNNNNINSNALRLNWVVLDNQCAHRLAPLSEGRIDLETRQMQCSYHGWTFDANGTCVDIPQATPVIQKAAQQNSNSCVPSVPIYVDPFTKILWIWPWKQDPLQFASEKWRFPEGIMEGVIPNINYSSIDMQNTTLQVTASSYTRDHPYGYDTLLENLIDPAHIPFAHHGLQGTRDDATPITMSKIAPSSIVEQGYSFDFHDKTMGQTRTGSAQFKAPYLLHYEATFDKSNRPWRLTVLTIPTKPGWSRVVVLNVAATGPETKEEEDDNKVTAIDEVPNKKAKLKKKKTPLAAKIFRLVPAWAMHLLSNRFFDSDLAFLHYQEQVRRPRLEAAKAAQRRGDAQYFMPAECDRSIAALHDWLDKYALSYLQQQSTQLPPAIFDRNVLFDRWQQHTSHCQICQSALAGMDKWKRRSKWGLVASILAIALWPIQSSQRLTKLAWIPKVTAVFCLAMMQVIAKLKPAFYKGEFKHYENH